VVGVNFTVRYAHGFFGKRKCWDMVEYSEMYWNIGKRNGAKGFKEVASSPLHEIESEFCSVSAGRSFQ